MEKENNVAKIVSCGKLAKNKTVETDFLYSRYRRFFIRESVDSLCRDATDSILEIISYSKIRRV